MTAAERTLDSLKPYPAYKDSGVEWIGEIPDTWKTEPIKKGYTIQLGKMLQPQPSGDASLEVEYLRAANVQDGWIDAENPKTMFMSPSEKAKFSIGEGDLLILEGGDIGRSALVTAEHAGLAIQNSLHRVRGAKGDTRFLHYAMQHVRSTGLLDVLCNKATIQHLTGDKLAALVIAQPQADEQTAIAVFLDHETARIDELVREQEQLLEDLADKKHAVCFHAVTQGVSTSTEITEADHPWINFSSSQWRRWKVSRAFGALGSGTTPPADMGDYYDGEIDWVNTGDLKDKPICSVPKRVTSDAVRDYPTLRQYPPGTVVMAMYGATIGKLGVLTATATLNQACCAFVEGGPVHNRFAFYWLLAMRHFIVALGYGGGQPNISQQTIRNMEIIAPDQAEQLKIADFLDERLAQIDRLVAEVRANIEDMKLLRSTLITAATTGKIDVCDWRPA